MSNRIFTLLILFHLILRYWYLWHSSRSVFRIGLLAGFRRVLRRFVLLRLDGIDSVLFGVELPVRITVVDLSPGMAGLLYRYFDE